MLRIIETGKGEDYNVTTLIKDSFAIVGKPDRYGIIVCAMINHRSVSLDEREAYHVAAEGWEPSDFLGPIKHSKHKDESDRFPRLLLHALSLYIKNTAIELDLTAHERARITRLDAEQSLQSLE